MNLPAAWTQIFLENKNNKYLKAGKYLSVRHSLSYKNTLDMVLKIDYINFKGNI